jgi:hypothetical protein
VCAAVEVSDEEDDVCAGYVAWQFGCVRDFCRWHTVSCAAVVLRERKPRNSFLVGRCRAMRRSLRTEETVERSALQLWPLSWSSCGSLKRP